MRPFNLDEYLKNPDQKLVNRRGDSVRILCTDLQNKGYLVVGAISCVWAQSKTITEIVCTYTKEGRVNKECESWEDLFFAD